MDKDDFKIVLLLIVNSRLTYREIAEQLGLSVNAVYKRVNALINLGIIHRFTAKIKPYAVDATYVFIFGESGLNDPDKLADDLAGNNHTSHVMLSSRNYLYVGSYLENIGALDEYSTFVAKTAKIESSTVGFLSGVHSASPIPYITPLKTPVSFSTLDRAIIRSLHNDSRKPISEVAEEVRSTANTVTRRINRMYQEGLLELSIDFYPLSSNDIFTVFQIVLDIDQNKNEFAKRIMDKFHPHIFFIWSFGNLPNFILCWVWCNNMKQLNEIITDLRKEKIVSLTSDVVHKAAFFDTWKEELLYE